LLVAGSGVKAVIGVDILDDVPALLPDELEAELEILEELLLDSGQVFGHIRRLKVIGIIE
jgi:hypothetical protein